ncbi:MAG: hypothetical protein VKK42_32220 [Lyngbya sp.]|nr:hypothetical protein [Lyngbya sp.]
MYKTGQKKPSNAQLRPSVYYPSQENDRTEMVVGSFQYPFTAIIERLRAGLQELF